MVIGTTSRKDVLRDFEMLNSFSAIIRSPYLTESSHLMAALEGMEAFPDPQYKRLKARVDGKRSVTLPSLHVSSKDLI